MKTSYKWKESKLKWFSTIRFCFYLFAQLVPQEHLSPKQLLEYLIFKQEKFISGHVYIHSGRGGREQTKQFFGVFFFKQNSFWTYI